MAEDASRPEDADEAEQAPEPAPTDLRRHVWLLVVILFVVLLSWVLGLLSRTLGEGPTPRRRGTGAPAAQRD